MPQASPGLLLAAGICLPARRHLLRHLVLVFNGGKQVLDVLLDAGVMGAHGRIFVASVLPVQISRHVNQKHAVQLGPGMFLQILLGLAVAAA